MTGIFLNAELPRFDRAGEIPVLLFLQAQQIKIFGCQGLVAQALVDLQRPLASLSRRSQARASNRDASASSRLVLRRTRASRAASLQSCRW